MFIFICVQLYVEITETTVNCVNDGGKINDILLFFSRCSLSHSSDLRHTHLTTHTLDLVLHLYHGCTIVAQGCTMVHHNTPWCKIIVPWWYKDAPWHGYNVPWCKLCVLWYTTVYHGIPLFTMVYHGCTVIPFHKGAHFGHLTGTRCTI